MSGYIVVGGGIAGLLVARGIARAGGEATVLESAGRIGGQLRSAELGGVRVDVGAEAFATRGGTVAALLEELGLGGDIVTPLAAGAWLHRRRGRAVPLPATGVLGIPGFPMAPDVRRAVGLPGSLRGVLDRALPASVGADAASIGELVARRQGRRISDRLVAPVVRGVHSVTAAELEVERAVPGLRAAIARTGSLQAAVRSIRATAPAGSAVASIRGGMTRLVDALERELIGLGVRIRTGVTVTAATSDAVDTDHGGLSGSVVLAAPGLTRPGVSPEGRAVSVVLLLVECAELDGAPRGTGLLVEHGAPGVAARALTHVTAKWEWLGREAGGQHLVRLSYDSEHPPPPELVAADAETLLGVRFSRVVDSVAVSWTRAVARDVSGERGIPAVGEWVAGSGIAGIVAQLDRVLRGMFPGN